MVWKRKRPKVCNAPERGQICCLLNCIPTQVNSCPTAARNLRENRPQKVSISGTAVKNLGVFPDLRQKEGQNAVKEALIENVAPGLKQAGRIGIGNRLTEKIEVALFVPVDPMAIGTKQAIPFPYKLLPAFTLAAEIQRVLKRLI